MMDEFGQDAPDKTRQSYAPIIDKPNFGTERKYLPSAADLIDRLAIVILKQINLPENRAVYDQERADIEHDLTHCVSGHLDGKDMSAVLILMLANKTIWDNEAKARQGGTEQNHLLAFTHSINGVRSRAKNVLAKKAGERIDQKTDCLAADLDPAFGAWNILPD